MTAHHLDHGISHDDSIDHTTLLKRTIYITGNTNITKT